MNNEPQPNPQTSPNPAPIEVDTGGLHSKPEVDYGSIPAQPPLEPNPDVPNEPEINPPEPDTDPAH
jgi:hypothetical protein